MPLLLKRLASFRLLRAKDSFCYKQVRPDMRKRGQGGSEGGWKVSGGGGGKGGDLRETGLR